MPEKQFNKALAFFPLLLFILNAGTRLWFLTVQDIALDEPFSIYHAQFGPGAIITQLKAYNNPPLFELILHFWIKLFGISPFAVRLLPLIFASLSPVALFYFGRRFFSLRVAVTSSMLLSASTLLMFYAHDCRAYTLFLLLGILSMYFFLALLSHAGHKAKPAACFVLFSALLIYTHYFGIFILCFQGVCLLFFYRRRLLQFTTYYVLILLAYLPHLYPLLTRMGHSVAKGTWLEPPAGVDSMYYMLWSFSNFPAVTVACILLLVAAMVKSLINKQYLNMDAKQALVLTWFLASFFGMFFVSYWVPMYISRYLIFVLPAYYILLATAAGYLFRRAVLANIICAALVAGFVFTLQWNPDKKQVAGQGAALVKRLKRPGTLVVVSPRDFLPSFAYNYNRQFFAQVADQKEYHTTDSLLRADHVFFINSADELKERDLENYKTVIFYDADEGPVLAEHPVAKALDKDFTCCHSMILNNTNQLGFFVRK